MEHFDYTPAQTPAPKKKKRTGLWIALILVAVLAAGVFLLRKPMKYIGAIALYKGHLYEAAAQQFEDMSGYRDADTYAARSRYGLAEYYLMTGKYEQAIEGFRALGDFEDSAVRLQESCYYRGMLALSAYDYETAADYLSRAGDYEDAREYTKQTLYAWGHSLFTEQKYAEAEAVFARLNGDYPEYGVPHFLTVDDAFAYCAEQKALLKLDISCYVAEMPEIYRDDNLLWNVLSNKVTYHAFSVLYDWDSGLLSVQASACYPSDRMLYAWRTGDESVLQEGEKEVLEQALALVEQAKRETDSDLALELWLHDWLCEHIVYSNPDMDIPTPRYLKLRELTCVGALVDGKANCQGYTDAFYLLGNLAGLQVGKLSGEAEEPHSWNVICIDGIWYTVDVTFDDLEDTDTTAKTYMWFNSAYVSDERSIHGGPEVLPGLSQTTNWAVTYYGYTDTVYASLDEAAYAMLRQYARNGTGWTHVVVEGVEADADDFYEAVDRNMISAGIWSASWTSVIEHVDGNTYLSIYWE